MKQSALFLLKASTVSKVSNSALDNIIGDIHLLLENSVQSLQDSVCAALQN